MAAVTKNTAKVRTMVAGATLAINDGTDDITIANIRPESFRLKPPTYERISYANGNTPQTPLEGERTIGSIEFNANAGALTGTQELITLAIARSSTNNAAKVYTSATFKIPDYDGALTGQQIVMTAPWFEMGPTYAGGKPDSIEGLKLCCKYADWASSTY